MENYDIVYHNDLFLFFLFKNISKKVNKKLLIFWNITIC